MTFRKFTTAYDAGQDRFRLSGEVEGDRVLTLWLTARLLQRLVPHLAKLISSETAAYTREGSLQVWQQTRARAAQAVQVKNGAEDPVPAAQKAGRHTMYLVQSVRVDATEKQVLLVFKTANEVEVTRLPLSALELRQWLAILHRKCVQCGWSTEGWPAWLGESEAQAPPSDMQSAILH